MTEKRLRILAGKNKNRIAVLEAREKRCKARSRYVLCLACNEKEFSFRSAQDICDQCLIDLWGAQSVLAGEYRASRGDGLVPVKLTERYHDLEYPSLATSNEDVPKKAVFARGGVFERTANTSDTMRMLYLELVTAMSHVLPCDPESRKKAERLIDGGGFDQDSYIFTRLPAPAVNALRDLWYLMRWHSHEAFRQGFEEGHNLLSRMNLGTITYEGFAAEITEQIRQTRVQLEKTAKGKPK